MTITTQFPIEFYTEYDLSPEEELAMYDEAEARLDALRGEHNDMTGATITLRKLIDRTSHDIFAISVVVYVRPNDVDASQEAENPMAALKAALDKAERQIRQQRSRLRDMQRGHHNRDVDEMGGDGLV